MSNDISSNMGERGGVKIGKIFLIVLFLIAFVLASLAGFIVGKFTEGKITITGNPGLYKETKLIDLFDNSLIKQAWTVLKNDFVYSEKLDEKALFYGALEGFVSATGDP